MSNKDYFKTYLSKLYYEDNLILETFICNLINNNKLVTFLNPYSYMKFRKLFSVFNKFDYLLSDGILLTFILKNTIRIKTTRLSFDETSLAKNIFSVSEAKGFSIYLVGSKSDEILKAEQNIVKNYPKINIIGRSSGYFKSAKEKEMILHKIVKKNPKLVIVGMGSGLQEEFLYELRNLGWQGTGFTCGAFFHQIIEKFNYYPKLINKLNLRSIYRLYCEPKLVFRYFFLYPIALFLFFWDLINYYAGNTNKK